MKISLKNSKVSTSNSFFNQRRLSQKITLISYQNQNLEYLSSDYFESQPTDWVFPCTTKSTLLRFWKLSDDLITLVKEKSPLSCMQCGIFPVSCDTINFLLIKTHKTHICLPSTFRLQIPLSYHEIFDYLLPVRESMITTDPNHPVSGCCK